MISQAMQFKMAGEAAESQKVNDLINNIYKMGMLEAQQPRPAQTFVKDVPGYGDLTLEQYKALPPKNREYISYVLASRQLGKDPLVQTEWEKIGNKDKIPTTAMGAAIANYYSENKKLPPESELKRWSELYRTPPVEVNIGEKAAAAAAVKKATNEVENINYISDPKGLSKDIDKIVESSEFRQSVMNQVPPGDEAGYNKAKTTELIKRIEGKLSERGEIVDVKWDGNIVTWTIKLSDGSTKEFRYGVGARPVR
jgi:hypothetical protein